MRNFRNRRENHSVNANFFLGEIVRIAGQGGHALHKQSVGPVIETGEANHYYLTAFGQMAEHAVVAARPNPWQDWRQDQTERNLLDPYGFTWWKGLLHARSVDGEARNKAIRYGLE